MYSLVSAVFRGCYVRESVKLLTNSSVIFFFPQHFDRFVYGKCIKLKRSMLRCCQQPLQIKTQVNQILSWQQQKRWLTFSCYTHLEIMFTRRYLPRWESMVKQQFCKLDKRLIKAIGKGNFAVELESEFIKCRRAKSILRNVQKQTQRKWTEQEWAKYNVAEHFTLKWSSQDPNRPSAPLLVWLCT